MNHPGSAREVLIAEALGDLARLLERAEALQSAMLESRQALLDAHAQLADQLATFEIRVAALMEKAKVQAVKHILARTDEAARQSVRVQTIAMSDAAKELFKAEINPALQRIAGPLRQLVHRVDRPCRRWQFCLGHATTAAVASSVSWALAAYLWAR